jgi:hypothetical protein
VNEVPPMVNANVPVGFFVNLARPVFESVFPPAALRNLLYADVGM